MLTFFEITPSFRGVSARKFTEKLRESSGSFHANLGEFSRSFSTKSCEEKMVCASLREISRGFLRESSRLRIFVRGVNAKRSVFLGLICNVESVRDLMLTCGYCFCG